MSEGDGRENHIFINKTVDILKIFFFYYAFILLTSTLVPGIYRKL